MNKSNSKAVEETLAKSDIHEQWRSAYRTGENQKFYEIAFDYITSILNAPENATLLDAGCGTCDQSIRLANRGFLVEAIDFSEYVLEKGRENVKAKGLEDKINIQYGNILALPFDDNTFNYILCWGVLMHIPDFEKAISELTRVIKPGGILVVSEGNMYSFESIILRNLKRILRREKATVKRTPAGIEYWSENAAGKLLTRQANIRWLIERFKSNQFLVKKRIAGQFTEMYIRVSSRLLRNLIHSFNNFWFRYIKIPHLGVGNIIFLQKEE